MPDYLSASDSFTVIILKGSLNQSGCMTNSVVCAIIGTYLSWRHPIEKIYIVAVRLLFESGCHECYRDIWPIWMDDISKRGSLSPCVFPEKKASQFCPGRENTKKVKAKSHRNSVTDTWILWSLKEGTRFYWMCSLSLKENAFLPSKKNELVHRV